MPKATTSKKRKAGGDVWSSGDHEVRKLEASRKSSKKGNEDTMTKRERRAHLLSHDTKNRREEQKVTLHLTKVTRELNDLRQRLEQWDQESEDRKEKEQQAKQQLELAKLSEPKKRRMRSGPETWKLTGAARPAWMVYDFDVRYVDPHAKEHQDFANAIQRQRNLLVLHKNQFGTHQAPPITRSFLSLLMQQAMLSLQAKKLKTARAALLECIALESNTSPITTARCHLIRLYLENNRPDSVRRLIEQYQHDKSCWVRFSAALIDFVSWNLLREEGSTQAVAEATLQQAIQANPLCALYLAFLSTFNKVMEYTDDVDEGADNSLEETIEYCIHEQGGVAWMETDGALDWLKQTVQRALHTKTVDWVSTLQELEKVNQVTQGDDNEEQTIDTIDGDENTEEDGVDVLMYVGMFRTTMEMLEESGELTLQARADESRANKNSKREENEDENDQTSDDADSNSD